MRMSTQKSSDDSMHLSMFTAYNNLICQIDIIAQLTGNKIFDEKFVREQFNSSAFFLTELFSCSTVLGEVF